MRTIGRRRRLPTRSVRISRCFRRPNSPSALCFSKRKLRGLKRIWPASRRCGRPRIPFLRSESFQSVRRGLPHRLTPCCKNIGQVFAIHLLFVKLSRSLQILSNFWTSSGSCPLCLTPPCYNLEPPATAAPFFFSGQFSGVFPGGLGRQLC